MNLGGVKGKGKGKYGKGSQCGHCGKIGHSMMNCWMLHPEQRWKGAAALDEVGGENEEYDIGQLEAVEDRPWIDVRACMKIRKTKASKIPGLK